jgi:F-type H+-transporting ATPase subunit epsilon
MPNLFVDIVSPAGSVFKGEAQGVRAPGVDGSFEVLYNHAPMIAAFEVGPLQVTTPSGEELIFATSGGFLEVLANVVTVLAETAEPAEGIDVDSARLSEEEAMARLRATQDPEERRRVEEELQNARNRLRVAMGGVGKGGA